MNACEPIPHTYRKIMSILYIFISLLCLTAVSAIPSTSQQSLRGDAIKCQNEGESVKVSLLSDDPCISCKCINKEIVCQREVCLNIKDCYLLHYAKNRSCCDVCKGCLYNGQYYKSGDKFHDINDTCKTFVCNSGVITQYNTNCYNACDNPLMIPGQCCPSCGKCETSENVDGHLIAQASNSSITDPCIKCECIEGNKVCSKTVCPVLPCPQSKWYIPENECCPKCKGHRKIHDFEGNCIMGLSAYRDGHSYAYDSCTDCVCNTTTNICQKKVCPSLDCPAKHQIIELGECCPKCHKPEEEQTSKTCSYMNREYKSGDKWNYNNCHMCSCVNGEVRCTAQICSKQLICPKRYKLTRLTGDCCNSCVEEDSVCRITNNFTQFSTFDGKEYEFSGKCNYILSRDCKSRTFSVHIVNKYKNESIGSEIRNNSLSGTSVMVKIENFKVRLAKLASVTIGRHRVRLPHIRLGILSIVKESNKVIVRANIGVKVIWESGKSIEILVGPEFKSRTCGLCGNYNNNPNDDFLTKKGKIYAEVTKFAHSWKVGKNLICETPLLTTKALKTPLRCSFKDWEQRYNAINVCNILKSSLFRQCHTSISITPYFGKCLSDVCSCHKTRICHCTAIQSYANQCQRLGFYSQHWKKKTLCEAMKCPAGSTFSTCTSACKRTCHNSKKINTPNDCRKRKCRPGCECEIGQVWHNSKCIYKQLCPKNQNLTQESTEIFNENFLRDESLLNN